MSLPKPCREFKARISAHALLAFYPKVVALTKASLRREPPEWDLVANPKTDATLHMTAATFATRWTWKKNASPQIDPGLADPLDGF